MKKILAALAATLLSAGTARAGTLLVNGAGATFPAPLYTKWFSDYNKLKPLTYVNLSGVALRNYLRRTLWSPSRDLLVVVDEVALPVGRYRLRARGSAGGHNGLKSVEMAIGNQEYARLRIGVGPSEERRGIYKDLADFVLAPFARDERETILALLPKLEDAVQLWLREGIERAMNAHNRRSKQEPKEESE